ncbi:MULTISPECIES: cytochrome d ubiquinol oxidase subunit II [Heyndrickxia]|jgi:cytochrome d ubiquinol oxidase subunit II|uniref:Cytochrome d ubiquinol oxidase, subunit II n=1 Tax=Heyndrickxia coagulans TaxID=1398 RepID=A0A133L4E9_HEYCO|nr:MULTISPECIES: cytochrome d ubiquinol oxidase subunit II [Heyndrickxia]AWP35689.1 cytochrome d ubiquinol oxidase subunit II [Heyndrickxia coagulans]KWZ86465.1 cytochrome d ubiquinol oxidase, subunit II [Heyndrickxia coagulans]MBQ4912242.1 cytochrome d ubiquinol oxidase subunit II [Heyndrickxia faecalis]MCI1576943.1 cytochrome d ubiquinol oxidase subunit II [Heyndrickxia coagulans]MEC2304973.1 cytochrome d ubiquinol oxidase subunit II [Weizmannia sp. CD-2023]
MQLNELWFLLVCVLFVGYVFLEGFDFGVGMSTKFLAKNETEKRVLINTIGPFWDANEVWLLTAGGAMFAAFPNWYATLFSGYYLAFVVLLLALIARGVAFEFRGKLQASKWKGIWDWAILLGSLLPPFLLGALFSGMIKGLPIDRSMTMHAGFFDIVNLYTIVGGLAFVALVYLHGLMFIRLKTDGEIRERAGKAAIKMYIATGAVVVLFTVLTAVFTDAFVKRGAILIPVYAVAIVLYLALYPLLRNKKEGLSFAVTGLILILVTVSFFIALFPNVLISSMGAANNLTLYKASSSPYSLKIMTIVACTMVPVVLAYTIWSYYVFRKRVTPHELHY